jgi:hypothetical protein
VSREHCKRYLQGEHETKTMGASSVSSAALFGVRIM